MRNRLEGTKNKLNKTEELLSDLEDKVTENT